MRTDTASLRTWWLAGCALWTLALWVAALAGLGSRLPPGSSAPTAAPSIPALPPLASPVLLSYSDYSQIAERPLFADDRRPHPFFLDGGARSTTGPVRLTGVLMVPGLDMATLTTEQGQSIRLRLGAEPEAGWQLLALQPRSATVAGPSGTQTLELAVFDGQGGQPPTVIGANRAGVVQSNAGPADPAAPAVATVASAGAASPPPPLPNPAAAVNNSDAATPDPAAQAQLKAIRERIQARRKQAQQNPNGSPPGQNP